MICIAGPTGPTTAFRLTIPDQSNQMLKLPAHPVIDIFTMYEMNRLERWLMQIYRITIVTDPSHLFQHTYVFSRYVFSCK